MITKLEEREKRAIGNVVMRQYPTHSAHVDIVHAELNGRMPMGNVFIVSEFDEFYMIISGSGELNENGIITQIELGDLIEIERGTKYALTGKHLKYFCATNPPWQEGKQTIVD